MKPRAALTLTAVAGLPCQLLAQEAASITWFWTETVGSTTFPIWNANSVLDPGEGARIGIYVNLLADGSSAIGQTTTYTPPPGPGIGTIRGLASALYDLIGTGGAEGAWSNVNINASTWLLRIPGTILNSGATVAGIGATQNVPPGQTANGSNPISNLWRGVWVPDSYSSRTVHWGVQDNTQDPSRSTGLLVQYGTDGTAPLYTTKFIAGEYGNGLNIPVVPAPATACAAALAFVAAGRRRL